MPPRIRPLNPDDAPAEALGTLRNWPYNLHKTLAHNIHTLTHWMPFAEHILRQNTLPEREREIAILRVAHNTQCAYEWGMHVHLARSIGFTDDDLRGIAVGSLANQWVPVEAALIDAVDDIMRDWKIGTKAWRVLAANFDEQQLIDFIFVTSQFILIAVTLNSLEIDLEPGLEPLPEIV